tara:strand:- start:3913 stop:4755 length:843 start_codon:yes stop_codon:yes gene_type:complete
MKNKIYLCSFASPDLKRSVNRFINQSTKINIYKKIKVFGHTDLPEKKKIQINNFLKLKQKRLYGYGCWKASIIKSYLNQIPQNSILQYSDIGCHFNLDGLERLRYYFNLCNKKNILTFQYKLPNFKKYSNFKFQKYYEYEFTKKDLINYLNISDKSKIFKTEQIMSGVIFFKNNQFSKRILEEWERLLSINNLIDDSTSKKKNHKKFIEHRHDQSIFSLICKKNNIFSLSASECEWAEINNLRTWNHLSKFPIHARRDKKYNILKRFINRQQKNIRRVFG